MDSYLKILGIAKVCHEANRSYCASLGDNLQLPWAECPKWQRQSAVDGVLFHLGHEKTTDSSSHEAWLSLKEKEGWVYGPVKDKATKRHPCMVPFEDLPLEQQKKDALFKAIVEALR